MYDYSRTQRSIHLINGAVRLRFHRTCRGAQIAEGRASGGLSGNGERSGGPQLIQPRPHHRRSEEHTSELQSLMRSSYAVLCLKKKKKNTKQQKSKTTHEQHNTLYTKHNK